MKIFVGADHRGFEMKGKLIEWLKSEGHDVVDCGNSSYDADDDSVDFGKKVAENLIAPPVILSKTKDLQNESAKGILFCGSGIEMAIAANRYKGVFCALGINEAHVRHGVENDHINCLSIPAEFVDEKTAKEMIEVFLKIEPKMAEKYLRRKRKLDEMKY